MTGTSKIITSAAAVMVVAMIGYGALDSLLLSPSRRLDDKIAQSQRKLADFNGSEISLAKYRKRLASLTNRAYDSDELRAKRLVRMRLLAMAKRSGLDNAALDFEEIPVTTDSSASRAYRQIGWRVKAAGTTRAVTDFLYMVNAEPYLGGVDNLSVVPDLASRTIGVTFSYLTLVLTTGKGRPPGPGELATGAPDEPAEIDLAVAARRRYDGIAVRDLFRPYVKSRPALLQAGPALTRSYESPQDRYRLVALSRWAGQDGQVEVLVHDIQEDIVRQYKIGDDLLGGKIVAVDYSPAAMPDEPALLSPSRIVLKIDLEYWSVELGQALGQKRLIPLAKLPELLRRPSTPDK
ncbi:MAG: hypothetical protein HQ546_05795 [Planctomycetes bacterium]|nr:hypothetical protein [Planctomycetota bacterium]